MTVKHAMYVILTCCILHNFLRTKTVTSAAQTNLADLVDNNGGTVVEGAWRDDPSNNMPGIKPTNPRNPSASALHVRDKLIAFLYSRADCLGKTLR